MYNMNFSDFDLSKTGDGLLPVVVQDADSLKVLMMAYMNEEAFRQTISSRKATFYSRSRQAIWVKGETSGNYIEVVALYPDCDNDTLLLMGRPVGPVCHRGTTACFDTPATEGFVRRLQQVVQDRHQQMPEGSYTTYLYGKGVNKIAQKVGEEAVETVIEAISGNRPRYLYEASDLLYHLLVLNEQMGVSLDDIEKELASRHK